MSDFGALDNVANENDLVSYFLLKEDMSQKKIQKLCYYAQAYSLVINDADIVDGIKFEAWVHGPVNVELRRMLGEYGWRDVTILSDRDSVEKRVYEKFTDEQISVLDSVWDAYGGLTADELEQLTHNEQPWLEKREGLGEFEAGKKIISNDTMKKYYARYYRGSSY